MLRITGWCIMADYLSADTALIIATITNASLCTRCIAKKAGIPLARIKPALARMGNALRVASAGALCDACLTAKKVFRLA